MAYKIIRKLKSPCVVELTLTEACNHKCQYCYNPWRTNQNKSCFISINNIRKIAKELSDNKVFHITISGGEPMMFFKHLLNSIKIFKSYGLSVSVNSNLTLITKSKAVALKEAGLNVILTSLPSADRKVCDKITQRQGSFDKIISGIKICLHEEIEVGVNTVVNKDNLNDVYKTGKFIAKLGVPYFAASIAIPPIYNYNIDKYLLKNEQILQIAKDLINIEKENKIFVDTVTPFPLCVLKDMSKYAKIVRKACTAGITHCTISYNGNIFACSHENKAYGNILKDGLLKSWANMQSWRNGKNINKFCKKCKYLEICGGECRIMSKVFPNKRYVKKPILVNLNSLEIPFSSLTFQNKKIQVNSQIRMRLENFGATINLGYTNNIFINKVGVKLLNLFFKLKEFSLKDLEQYIKKSNKLNQFISYLISKNVLLIKYANKKSSNKKS